MRGNRRPGTPPGVVVTGPAVPGSERVLTTEALAFIADLQRRSAAASGPAASPHERQAALDPAADRLPGFDPRGP